MNKKKITLLVLYIVFGLALIGSIAFNVIMSKKHSELEQEYYETADYEAFYRQRTQTLIWALENKVIEGRDIKDIEIELYLLKQDKAILMNDMYVMEVLFRLLGQYSGVDGREFEMWLYENHIEVWRWVNERNQR